VTDAKQPKLPPGIQLADLIPIYENGASVGTGWYGKDRDPEKVVDEEHWMSHPGPWGVRCGPASNGKVLVVVDAEHSDKGHGDGIRRAEQLHLPRTYTTRSRGGGLHCYYWVRPQLDLGREIGRWEAVDYLGTGGYVRLYPPVNACPIAELHTLPAPDDAPADASESRDRDCYEMACSLVNRVKSYEELCARVWTYSSTFADKPGDPWTRKQSDKCCRSAWNEHRQEPETKTDPTALDELKPRPLPEFAAAVQELKPRENLIGPLRMSSWGLIAAHAGVGKSLFSLALAATIATGGRLGQWQADKARKVLYIDGEMSEQDYRERLKLLNLLRDDSRLANLQILTLADYERLNLPYFSVGSTVHQRWVEGLDWDCLIVDNLECTLEPLDPKTSIWAPETWHQLTPWLNRSRARGRWIGLVDHLNSENQLQGTMSKRRGADFIMRLQGDASEADEVVAFNIFMTQRRGGKCRYGADPADLDTSWSLNQQGGWGSEAYQDEWDMAATLKKQGKSNADIAKELDLKPGTVQKHFARRDRKAKLKVIKGGKTD
jgi:putative DNA primase/helicase